MKLNVLDLMEKFKNKQEINSSGKITELYLEDITTESLIEEALRRYNTDPCDKNFDHIMKLWEKKQNIVDESDADTILDVKEIIAATRSQFETKETDDKHDKTSVQDITA